MGSISLGIPQAGQTFATEGAKVATDMTTIQAVINGNLDSTNLSASAAIARSQMAGSFGNLAFTPVSTNTSCVDGSLYYVSAASTMTLPTATLNRTIGVMNGIGAGGVVTVTAGSGVILGLGLGAGGVSSITLGTTYAAVVLVGGGTNWAIASGQQDTGWLALSLTSGFAALGGAYTPAARLIGDRVFLRGAVNNGSAGSFGNAAFATIPSGLRPASTVYTGAGSHLVQGSGETADMMLIATGGGISMQGAFGPNSSFAGLDGINFSLA